MTTYVLDIGDVNAELAEKLVADFIGSEGFATLITQQGSEWGSHIVEALGIETADSLPSLTKLDTVIGFPDEDAVRSVITTGASYLDITNGLVKITVEDAPDVPESPDLDNVAEPKKRKPLKKPPTPRAKKTEPAPVPETPEVLLDKNPQGSQKRSAQTLSGYPTEDLIRELVSRMIAQADEELLWKIAELLRDRP